MSSFDSIYKNNYKIVIFTYKIKYLSLININTSNMCFFIVSLCRIIKISFSNL